MMSKMIRMTRTDFTISKRDGGSPMNRRTLAVLTTASLVVFAPAGIHIAQQTKPTAAARPQTPAANVMSVDARNAFVKEYCSGCHNDTQKSGGMTLTSLDMAHP